MTATAADTVVSAAVAVRPSGAVECVAECGHGLAPKAEMYGAWTVAVTPMWAWPRRSVQGRGVFVRQPTPHEQFIKRYNESLEEMAAQRRADEEAVRLSGKTDDDVAAELAAAEERFAKASAAFEAATAHRDALKAVMEQRKRLSGNYTPKETAAKAQRLHDRLAERGRRR